MGMNAPLNDRLVDDEVVRRVLAGGDPGRRLSTDEQYMVAVELDRRQYTTNTIAVILGVRTSKVKNLLRSKGKGIA